MADGTFDFLSFEIFPMKPMYAASESKIDCEEVVDDAD
jgi:hypothetical protein